MFGMFKKKSEVEKLEDQYKKKMKEGLGNGHWRIHDRIRMMPYRQILC